MRTLLAFACCLLPIIQQPTQPPAPPKPQASPTPTVTPNPIPFPQWLATLRADALARGVSQATVNAALKDLALDSTVLDRDRAQPELTKTLEEYVSARLLQKTIDAGRLIAEKHKALLERIDKTYGVSAPLMVAIWAVESNYGAITGTKPTIASLATLAYDGRRPDLFRGELFRALTILDLGLITLPELKGSWAGAMGQPQFMPSSYLNHAIDFDGDGRVDIWNSEADVLASMANYLKAAHWVDGEWWGLEVAMTPDLLATIDNAVPKRTTGCRALKEMTEARPMTDWVKLGVKGLDGTSLPATTAKASLVRGTTRAFLVYRNYNALIDYNCSNVYAISVGLLADRIAAPSK